VKQENENLQIVDVRPTAPPRPVIASVDVRGPTLQVRDSTKKEVKQTDFMTPSAFIFLYENQLFLTFRNRAVSVWNFRGELVTR
jgi:hypothetical protein